MRIPPTNCSPWRKRIRRVWTILIRSFKNILNLSFGAHSDARLQVGSIWYGNGMNENVQSRIVFQNNPPIVSRLLFQNFSLPKRLFIDQEQLYRFLTGIKNSKLMHGHRIQASAVVCRRNWKKKKFFFSLFLFVFPFFLFPFFLSPIFSPFKSSKHPSTIPTTPERGDWTGVFITERWARYLLWGLVTNK